MKSNAAFRLKHGADWPYDAPDNWYVDETSKPPAATDWAHRAARGILCDLNDRHTIKRGFENIDLSVRKEIVDTIAEIIRESANMERGTPA